MTRVVVVMPIVMRLEIGLRVGMVRDLHPGYQVVREHLSWLQIQGALLQRYDLGISVDLSVGSSKKVAENFCKIMHTSPDIIRPRPVFC